MKYEILEQVGHPTDFTECWKLCTDAVVTPIGEVAFWDDSAGWSVEKDQTIFKVRVIEL